MKQFRFLACNGTQLSLCLLPAYLDAHALPEEIGKLSLSDLVAHKAVLRDDEHPGYYFTEKLVLGIKGMQLPAGRMQPCE